MQNGKGANLPDDSIKQSCCLFCIVSENHKLVTELREVSLNSLSCLSKRFLYYFDQHPDYPADDKNFGRGSYHGQDINFVFQHTANFERPEVDIPLTVAMGKYWTVPDRYFTWRRTDEGKAWAESNL